jgi:HD-GYP domain-containing protein (c-di-GMP phosphodiesterase class II)
VTIVRPLEAPPGDYALFRHVRISSAEAQVGAVLDLVRRDSDLFLHGCSVGRVAERMALELEVARPRANRIRLAAVLHDIGKLAVPRSVLSKRGPLTDRERRIVERHPSIGAAVVKLAGLHFEAHWIRHHHERMDGRGYPDGVRGDHIPLPSRIILVADAFDALTSDRPYRSARTPAEAFMELAAHSGSQFDPDCVEALGRLLAPESHEPRALTD